MQRETVNGICLYGTKGAGKTSLMKAIIPIIYKNNFNKEEIKKRWREVHQPTNTKGPFKMTIGAFCLLCFDVTDLRGLKWTDYMVRDLAFEKRTCTVLLVATKCDWLCLRKLGFESGGWDSVGYTCWNLVMEAGGYPAMLALGSTCKRFYGLVAKRIEKRVQGAPRRIPEESISHLLGTLQKFNDSPAMTILPQVVYTSPISNFGVQGLVKILKEAVPYLNHN
eukprot:TRINITY_DN24193_c0_g1_i1.p1 TRINITY_DN24193_c0_g1~~TRINITY_DN24193_c0_g1_i1.p1  ORF type:complete len:223 (-),score=14.11 TRINITY_DN24193_c0_g1_i1:9-677(-)